ncbi:MAG: CpaF family protein [Anaerolineae bacterium]|nr:CpaF family protein [Anaerolineae bacterium]
MGFWNRNRPGGPEPAEKQTFHSPFAAAATADTGGKDALDHITDTVSEQVVGARLLTGNTDQDESAVLDAARRVIDDYNVSAASQGLPILTLDPEEAARKVLDRILGWGPLTDLMEDGRVEDIAVNGLGQVWVFRAGADGWEHAADLRIPSWDFLRNLINRKADFRGTGRAITYSYPSVNAQLPDGSRLHGVMRPLTVGVDGPAITIRRFRPVAASVDDLARLGSFPTEVAGFLKAAMRSGLNVAVIGGTGSGKTTFINAMLAEVQDYERVVTCEDTAEVQVASPNFVSLVTKDAMEGSRGFNMADLVKETLRMRPDRIIVGEVRDGAMAAVLQAANTGHDGVMFTVHANSPFEGIERMETMALMEPTWSRIPIYQIRKMIASAMHLIVHLAAIHTPEGRRRRLMNVAEIRGMQGDQVTVEVLFSYDYDLDRAKWTGIFPNENTRARLQRRAAYDFRQGVVDAVS